MKVLVVLLVCSLAANAAYLIVRGFPSSPSAPPPPAAVVAAIASSPEAQREAIATLFDAKRTDATALKTQLEAAGFPPEIARAMAMAQVQHEFNQRQRTVLGEIETPPFWKTSDGIGSMGALPPDQQNALNALRREREARMKELTDGTYSREELASATAQQRWGPIAAEKIASVRRIEGDYAELQRELIAGRSPMNLPAADQEKLALLNRERRADIESLLSPEELFEYDVRQSPTSSRLRSQLSAFQPSEEEFRAIFRIQHERDRASGRDAAFAGVIFVSSTDNDTDRAAQLAEAKTVLTPGRYADYEFATDSRNRTLALLANRFGVPTAAAREVAAIRDTTAQAMTELRRDTSKAPAERNALLAGLTRSAVERVSVALGPDAYRAYLENGGSWLTQSAGPASRPSPPSP